jgi:hypothetical protein
MINSDLPRQSDARGSRMPSTASIVGTAMFAVGAFWALDVFGLGMMSLLVNRDVITDPRAGVGLGLAMVAAATLALVGSLIRVALRRAVTVRITTIASIVALVYVAYLLSGIIVWVLFAGGLATDGLFFALGMAIDWPALIIAINALIVTLAYFATLSYRMKHQNPFDPGLRSG